MISSQAHSNVKLQLAATFCISNLIWNEEDGEANAMTGCHKLGGGSYLFLDLDAVFSLED